MDSLGKIFHHKAADTPILRAARSSVLIDEANKVMARLLGPASARLVRAVHFKDGVLSVACLSTAAADDLKSRENAVLAELTRAIAIEAQSIRYII